MTNLIAAIIIVLTTNSVPMGDRMLEIRMQQTWTELEWKGIRHRWMLEEVPVQMVGWRTNAPSLIATNMMWNGSPFQYWNVRPL